MNYETVYLSVDAETAKHRIAERVPSARVNTENGRYVFTSNAGHILAVLADTTLPSGEQGSKLRYRTAIISGHHLYARTAARKIRAAVEPYRVR